MKKLIFILFCLSLYGCVSEPPKESESNTSQAVGQNLQENQEGYEALLNQVWMTKDYPSENQIVKIYNTKTSPFQDNLLDYLSDQNISSNVTEQTVDNQTEQVIQFEDTQITVVISNKTGAVSALYTTPNGDKAEGIINLYDNLSYTEIFDNEGKKEVDGQTIQAVKTYMALFQAPYEYDFMATSISSDLFKEIQEKGGAWLDKEEKDNQEVADLLSMEGFDFDIVQLVPVLDEIPLIHSDVHLGATNQVNVISGPRLTFIVQEGEIIFSYLLGIHTPGEVEGEVEVKWDQVLEGIKKRYEDLQLDQPVYIESVQVQYAPIAKVDEGALYKEYTLQPLVEVIVRQGEELEGFFISPITYSEVR